MGVSAKDTGFFSDICTLRCGGLCCDPWWGIISYQVVKKGGLSGLNSFKAELAQGIDIRLELIAMFAFRCKFLSAEKTCLIHPTPPTPPLIKGGVGGAADIR